MSITVNIYYKGENGSARKFAEEMVSYDLHMKVERYISNDEIPKADKKFIRE